MVTVSCKTCGKETKKSTFYIKKFEGRVYCSKGCYYDSIRKPKIERICEQCKQSFMAYPSVVNRGYARFCSKECKDAFNHGENSYKWKRVERNCLNCNKTFQIEAWRLKDKRSNRGKLCSIQCRKEYQVKDNSPNWRGIDSKPKENLYNWRMSVLRRDKYACVQCGNIELLQADHIKPIATHPELMLDINNGRTLCLDCHKKTPTWGRTKAHYKKLML